MDALGDGDTSRGKQHGDSRELEFHFDDSVSRCVWMGRIDSRFPVLLYRWFQGYSSGAWVFTNSRVI